MKPQVDNVAISHLGAGALQSVGQRAGIGHRRESKPSRFACSVLPGSGANQLSGLCLLSLARLTPGIPHMPALLIIFALLASLTILGSMGSEDSLSA